MAREALAGAPVHRRRRLLVLGLAAPLALVGGLWLMDAYVRSMVYPAPAVRVPSPPPAPLVEVPLEADGHAVSAWWLPPPRAGAPALLMLHGNGENLETMRAAGLFDEFHRLGAGVLAVDYPGYGRSAGSPREAANVAAAEAGWRWLEREQGAAPRAIAGWSLGAAVAAQVAARHGAAVDGLLLLSPWDRLVEVAALHFPRWLVSRALPERYDTVDAASRIACRSLVVHGERDDLIPAALGRRAYEALPEPKRWLAVRGAGHNDLLSREEVWRAVAEFLAAVEGAASARQR